MTQSDSSAAPRGDAIEEHDSGLVFDAATPLDAVLAHPRLPAVLRRALERSVPASARAETTLADSVRRGETLLFRAWLVALLAYDVGVALEAPPAEPRWDGLLGLFARGALATERYARFFVPRLAGGQGFGAAASGSVCAAAFLYRDERGCLEADFVLLGGATDAPVAQLELAWQPHRRLDQAHVERALEALAPQVRGEQLEAAHAVVREALLEALAALDRS